MRLKLLGAVAWASFAMGTGFDAPASAAPRPEEAPAVKPERIYLQPLDDFPASRIAEITNHYFYLHGLTLTVLPSRSVPAQAVDAARRQLRGEEVLAFMRRQNTRIAADPRNVIIGFTTQDMFPQKLDWAYAWAWREWRVGVISTARLDPAWYGRPPDPALLGMRLRKVVAKTVALLYYRLPVNDNPRSALYRALSTVEDIDGVSEDF